MKCPVCKTKIENILEEECPICKTRFDDFENLKRQNESKNNADILEILINIYFCVALISSSIFLITKFNTTNFIIFIITVFTETLIYYLFKVIIDIHNKICE